MAMAECLGARLEVVLARKLAVPASPETGFGAVALDGSVVLNHALISYYGITTHEIDRIVAETRRELLRRSWRYSESAGRLDLSGRAVFVVDDGLATGYTVMSAARMVRSQLPRSVVLAVPVATAQTLKLVESEFDQVHCFICQDSSPFAVASHYGHFPDLADEEVQTILQQHER